MEHKGAVDPEDDSGLLSRLAPSPHSEAVAHEFQELSLQPNRYLPPLNERKNVLQLKLQQRRTREQLVDQGIMPPLKSPAAFHEQIKSLERARTENFLKHKIRSRPDRSELVRMHILEETFAEPSLQATQMKLKRARLADDLNEKIAQRPGPMELVEKNILPVDSSVKEAIIAVGQENYPQALDDFSFDEDSSDALSPDQPGSQESQGSTASPGEPKTREIPSPVTPASSTTQYPSIATPGTDFLKPPVTDQHVARTTTAAPLTTNSVTATKHCSGPTLIKQPHPKNPNDRPRSKKCKEPKPRVKKLKYHQYIPPDQKGEKNEPPMDSNYARLLQQQQLFLQLQILSQQQQHYNYQTILPAPLKPVNDKQGNTGNIPLNTLSNSTSTVAVSTPRQNTSISNRKPGPLPPSLDDLKVAELKMELKLRGLPVSGTKMDLIERLKPYQDLNNNSVGTSNTVAGTASSNGTSKPGEIATSFPPAPLNKQAVNSVPSTSSETTPVGTGSKIGPLECVGSPLPISPSPSEQSSLGTDDTNMADTLTEIMTMMSPSQFPSTSPLRAAPTEDGSTSSMDLDATEKDRKLQEKEKQIEELKRKLEQEQKLVEVLKMQLEVEKRSHQQQSQASAKPSMTLNQQHNPISVKKEDSVADSSEARRLVPDASHSLGQPRPADVQNPVAKKAVVIKQEIPLAKVEPQNVISQFYVSSQRQPQTAVVAHPQALLAAQGTAQLLLPLSLQGPNSAASVQLPASNIQVQTQAGIPAMGQVSASSGLAPKVPQMHMSAPKQNASPQHAVGQTSQNRKVFPPTSPNTVFSYQNQTATNLQQPLFNQASNTTPHSGNQAPLVQNGPNALQKPPSPPQSQQYILQQSLFNNSGTKTKDPPRYEEAIKQTRSLQSSHREISSAHSQQMDDLFDILIKSGEISMPMKEEPSLISKMRPVTANITTMPVNTVVSRPPPQVQMAPPLSLELTSNFSLALENHLEALLEGTLPSGNGMSQLTSGNEDKESFSVIEDLQNDLLNHSGILDHSQSPMETSDSQFTPSSCLSLDLPDPNLDNMEWLDLTMPNASSGLTPLSSTAPSMFSTDFLDPQDLQLQWD
ncbi:MKL/myocardin-like protein 2 isoform X1 [Python bivittatus]|uniref:MKL/myocardin-like protein 2 isoform X1 n=1 Tax=Python bivittatus TaxID=176946 RepID=A0A9F5MQ38_PYTBI|nr:MKL/myocardin-like protein 2 isoform X1 [Python bivittatus]XP_025021244.1 MKL/myocardin-like protein 2 isoform X1 [Python bivittatus]